MLHDECGAHSLFGPGFWDDEFLCLCDNDREGVDFFCEHLATLHENELMNDSIPLTEKQVSIQTVMHVVQQSILQTNSKYNPDFCENGWFTEPEVYDYTGIQTEVRSQFIVPNMKCESDLNMKIEGTIPSQTSIKIYKDGRSPMQWTSGASFIDDKNAWGNILADLNDEAQDAVCV